MIISIPYSFSNLFGNLLDGWDSLSRSLKFHILLCVFLQACLVFALDMTNLLLAFARECWNVALGLMWLIISLAMNCHFFVLADFLVHRLFNW